MVLDYLARIAAVIRERELRGVGLLPGRNFYDLRNALHENITVVVVRLCFSVSGVLLGRSANCSGTVSSGNERRDKVD